MRITFNYGARDIFGLTRDISSIITATVERVDKVFNYMKSHRTIDGFSCLILTDESTNEWWSFCYYMQSDVEKGIITVEHNGDNYYKKQISVREARKLARTLVVTKG